MINEELEVLILPTIREGHPEAWNKLVDLDNPFVKYEFFEALEKSGCVNNHTGWHPRYFILKKNQDYLCAFVAFVKVDSYGEFIFDWDWARAFEQYQIPYYPKLTSAIPFSPITAPKILGSLSHFEEYLLPPILDFYNEQGLSGFHLLFTGDEEQRVFSSHDFKQRDSFQYHWLNEDYATFSDFLSLLKKNRRKSIKRERKAVAHLKYIELEGHQVTSSDLDYFYNSYIDTIDRKYSQAYLNRDFFRELFRELPHNTILLQAIDPQEDKIVANALFLNSHERLYGRYWGCSENIEFLHFEMCMYRGIDIAIKRKLKVFEAGAQGEHKRLRGFRPIKTKSLHHIKHPQFSVAINEFIERESHGIEKLFGQFSEVSPFKSL